MRQLFYYKMRQKFVTECVRFFYYKMQRLWQIATGRYILDVFKARMGLQCT